MQEQQPDAFAARSFYKAQRNSIQTEMGRKAGDAGTPGLVVLHSNRTIKEGGKNRFNGIQAT